MDEQREAQAELDELDREAVEQGREWEAFHDDLRAWHPVSELGLPMADHER